MNLNFNLDLSTRGGFPWVPSNFVNNIIVTEGIIKFDFITCLDSENKKRSKKTHLRNQSEYILS